ncbi:hypothetical protein HanIR_Chr12g0575741 [Helianthus annuus]|nr:hypothetical protein HanIR_Chr12g0575741 [Helianthus annuus]
MVLCVTFQVQPYIRVLSLIRLLIHYRNHYLLYIKSRVSLSFIWFCMRISPYDELISFKFG